MWTFCLSCLFLMLLPSIHCFSYLSAKLSFLQHWCTNSIPVEESDHILWQALVCAQPFPPDTKWKYWLQLNGLIHLFVVSGSHFIVLQWILKKLKTPTNLQFFVLWFYNALTGFSPPGTRACVTLSFCSLFRMKSEQKLFAISLLCLAMEPKWITSYSFWLSWLASLILLVTPPFRFELLRNFIFYFTWILLGFSVSIWSIPMNLILGPLISWILFPLAFLSYLPGVSYLFHFACLALEKILDFFSADGKSTVSPVYILQLGGLVLLTHLILHLRNLECQGKKMR